MVFSGTTIVSLGPQQALNTGSPGARTGSGACAAGLPIRVPTHRQEGGQPTGARTSRRRILPVGPFGGSGSSHTSREYL
ncbi:hypothetical protein GCM10009583_01820 [Ornithinicoccus hortensis]